MKQKQWMSVQEYRSITKKTPLPCVDLVLLRGTINEELEVLVLIRKTGYEKGKYCIMGGRQRIGETLQDTVNRQASELGVTIKIIPPFSSEFPAVVNSRLKQDKTKQTTCSVYPVRVIEGNLKKEGKEFEKPKWVRESQLPNMAYDHAYEINYAIKQVRKFCRNIHFL